MISTRSTSIAGTGVLGTFSRAGSKVSLCRRKPYMLELVRYIVLNPVRPCMVKHP